jgi:hypothetical protein
MVSLKVDREGFEKIAQGEDLILEIEDFRIRCTTDFQDSIL